MKAQRDVFIEGLFLEAKKDSRIVFISVDMGAPALDQWRNELPDQFIAAGISEQNAINVAAGLSASGKKPYVYMMACWVARCFEQIRYSCAMAGNPITILGNGVALGYAPAGPAHEPTEDLAYMRAIEGLEILSPSSIHLIPLILEQTLNVPKLRYIRLERSVSPTLSSFEIGTNAPQVVSAGMTVLKEFNKAQAAKKVTIFSSGYLLQKTLEVQELLEAKHEMNCQVVDLWRIKPLNAHGIAKITSDSDFIVTVEEQALSAAFGAAIIEGFSDEGILKNVLRIGLDTAYVFDNGNRDQLLDSHGLSTPNILEKILLFHSMLLTK